MPENDRALSAGQTAGQTNEPPMKKRVVRKEDGRKLIYYAFQTPVVKPLEAAAPAQGGTKSEGSSDKKSST